MPNAASSLCQTPRALDLTVWAAALLAGASSALADVHAERSGTAALAASKQASAASVGGSASDLAQRRAALPARIKAAYAQRDYARISALYREQAALAEAAGDADGRDLADIERIFAEHDDDHIAKAIADLTAVRDRLTPHSGVAVRERLEAVFSNFYSDVGQYDLALRHARESLRWAAELPQGAVGRQRMRWIEISELHKLLGNADDALQAVATVRSVGVPAPLTPEETLFALSAQAGALALKGDQRLVAFRDYQTALAMAQAQGSAFGIQRVGTALAALALELGRPEAALHAAELAWASAHGRASAFYEAQALALRGDARVRLGQVQAGLADLRAAAAHFERVNAPLEHAGALQRLAAALKAQGQLAGALDALEAAQAVNQRLFQRDQARALGAWRAQMEVERQRATAMGLQAQNQVQGALLKAEQARQMLYLAVAVAASLGLLLLALLYRRLRADRNLLSQHAHLDALTGAYNRRRFAEQIKQHPAKPGLVRRRVPYLLMVVDLDHFKRINDEHGHACGDHVLVQAVAALRAALRGRDEIYRWGGEEFVLLLRDSPASQLAEIAERVRASVAAMCLEWEGKPLVVTTSIGAVAQPFAAMPQLSVHDAIAWADAALFMAKAQGRNRVVRLEPTALGAGHLPASPTADLALLAQWQAKGWLRIE